MSGTHSIPPVSTRSTIQGRKDRKIKTSFQDGILQEYGSAKFPEIKDNDPLLYAHSKRPKAIFQAKALRQIDKALGLVPQAYRGNSTLTLKEKRKRANRLTYENGVIGTRAVQECIRDLYIGYDIRYASQKLKLDRLRNANLQLEQELDELRFKQTCCDAFQNEQIARTHIHPSVADSSNQAFGQVQLMLQGGYNREMNAEISHPRESSSFVYQRPFPSERRTTAPARADQTHESHDQRTHSNAIPYQYQRIFSPSENQLSQTQTIQSLNNQQAAGFQPPHVQLSQHQVTRHQKRPPMNEQQTFMPHLQPYHLPLDQQAGQKRFIFPVNKAPQHLFHDGQSFLVLPRENCRIQDNNGANQIAGLGRQDMLWQVLYPGLYPQTRYEFNPQIPLTQNVHGVRNGMAIGTNPVLQNGQTQMVAPQWNSSIPAAYSNAIPPTFHLGR